MAYVYFLIGPAITSLLGAIIILAWRATPARRKEAPVKTPLHRSRSFIVSVILGLPLGWLITSDYLRVEKSLASTCASVGRCHVDWRFRFQGVAALDAMVKERRFFTHGAHGEAECRQSLACEHSGECTLDKGACVATTEADCAPTIGCERYGACYPIDGKCATGAEP